MCGSIFKKLCIFTFFFFDITYETLLRKEFVWKGKKHFYVIWCWFIFHLINKSFYLVHEFVFCNKLDRIRIQNFAAKVAYCANIPRSNIKHLTHIRMFTDVSLNIYIYIYIYYRKPNIFNIRLAYKEYKAIYYK